MKRLKNFLTTPVYHLYGKRLLRKVQSAPMPRHIGLILDGNRRYGRLNKLTEPQAIYASGADRLDALLEWCVDLRIPAITLWIFSTDNISRRSDEVSGLLTAIEQKLRMLAVAPSVHRSRVRVRAVGRLELLPQSTQAAVRAAEAATKAYEGLQLTLAAAYGGRQEIVDAMRSLLRDPAYSSQPASAVADRLTTDTLSRYMYAPDLPDLDLIIRTSGEIRLSGFLLWQSAYSEFYFTDVFWPAFRRIDFLRAIRAFQQRQRRFGK